MRRKLLSVFTLLTCLITVQSINQPIDQSIHSLNQPIDQSHDQPTDQSTNQSINQSKLGIWWSPVVNTTSGLYQGYTYQSINYYMGMRYAHPPINQLRFAHPQPINQPIDQSINRAYFHGSMCPQIIAGPLWLGNEDCLYINVYAPVNDQSTHQSTRQSATQSTDQSINQSINQSLKPVFVWIYGGSFVFGDGYEFGLYEASNMVLNSDVVVVTFNYRLGPLGFMALDALSKNDSRGATGNAGLADQRLALQWVHDNIREFGGDPDRVTIGGESAGAMSVCSQMAHQLHLTHQSTNPSTKQSKDESNDRASEQSADQSKDPLFHRVIMQSGTCDSSTFWPDRQSSIDWSLYYASMLGCSFNQSTNQPTGLEDSDRLVDCLRKLPLDVFVKASKSKNINPSTNPSVHPSTNQSTSQPSDYDEWSLLTKKVLYNPRSNAEASLEDVAQWHAEQTAESTHQSIKRSINQSIKQSVNPPPLPILYPAVPWTPVIDGVFLTDTPLSMIESIYKSTSRSTSQSTEQPINQSIKPLPVLIGTNLDEGTLFLRQLYQILPDQLHDPLIDTDLPLIYQHVFGNQSINQSNNQTIIELINQHYPSSDFESINELIEVLLRDYIFACPSRRLLSTIYQSVNHQPIDQSVDQSNNQSANQSTWLYQYRYNPGWIDNYFLGVYHSAELEFVFGNAWPPIIHPFDETSRLIVDLIGDKWGNFMKYGNPNQPTNQSIDQSDDQSIYWPAWNPATKLNLQIEHPPSINQHLLDKVCHFWDSVDQSINLSMKQSKQKKLKQALQSMNQSIDQSTDQSTSQPSQAHPREVFASE